MIPTRLLASVVIADSRHVHTVFACQCVPPPPNTSAPDLARWYAGRTDAIYIERYALSMRAKRSKSDVPSRKINLRLVKPSEGQPAPQPPRP